MVKSWGIYGSLLMLLSCGAACKKAGPAQASVAKGATFSLPVPAGYKASTDPRLTKGAPGGVVLMAAKRVVKGAFLGSIVVTRVPPGPDFDLSQQKVCQEIADQMVKTLPVKLERAELVDTAVGKTCQYELTDKKLATRKALGTVMYKTRDNCWVVTCNFDTRDDAARPACASVLGGFKFN